MKKHEKRKRPAELRFDEGAPSFARHRRRLKKLHPSLADNLQGGFSEIRAAYEDIRRGQPLQAQAGHARLGDSLGSGQWKKRLPCDSKGRRGSLRLVYHLDLEKGIATPLLLFERKDNAETIEREIKKVRAEKGSS